MTLHLVILHQDLLSQNNPIKRDPDRIPCDWDCFVLVGPACRAGLRGPAATSDINRCHVTVGPTEITATIFCSIAMHPAYASPCGESPFRQKGPTGFR